MKVAVKLNQPCQVNRSKPLPHLARFARHTFERHGPVPRDQTSPRHYRTSAALPSRRPLKLAIGNGKVERKRDDSNNSNSNSNVVVVVIVVVIIMVVVVISIVVIIIIIIIIIIIVIIITIIIIMR